MKTLTKIKLINWHGFYNDTIDVRDSVLITGENGSGKSSLLDALYFLLTGGEENKFNSAANEKAARTLETYMRGKTGIEGKTYLRSDLSLISHIAVEFYDDVAEEPFVIGVVLEIQDDKSKIGRTFYHLKRRGITDDLFIREEDGAISYVNYKVMRASLRDSDINVLDGSRPDIRSKIAGILSLENKRYYELLPKALAFKPIADVNDFVYKFLMPQKNVNIDNIRTLIRRFNELKRELENSSKKKAALERMMDLSSKRSNNIAYKKNMENRLLQWRKEGLECDINTLETKKENNEIRLAQVSVSLEVARETLDGIKRQIVTIENGEQYSQVAVLEGKLPNVQRAYNDAERGVMTFNKRLLDEGAIADEFGIEHSFSKWIKNTDFANLVQDLRQYQVALKKKKEELNKKHFQFGERIENEEKTLDSLQNELQGLKRGILRLPSETSRLIQLLDPIVKSDSPYARPTPLCELIDIDTESEPLRNVLESALGERRFAILVPESSFEKCYEVFQSLKTSAGLDGAILVNIKELKEVKPAESSLARYIVTEDPRARKYVDNVLREVVLAQNQDSLLRQKEAYSNRVSAHKEYGLFHVDPETYRIPAIGVEAKKIRIQQLESEISECTDRLANLKHEKMRVDSLIRKGNQAKYLNEVPVDNPWLAFDRAKEELSSITEQLRTAKEALGDLAPELDDLKRNEGKTRAEIDKLEKDQTSLSNENAVIESQLPGMKTELEDTITRLQESPVVSIAMPEDIVSLLDDENRPVKAVQARISALEKNINSCTNDIVLEMKEYINTFAFDAVPNIDSLNIFEIEYNNAVLRSVEQYSARLEEVKAQTNLAFQNAYIAEIQNNIREEEANIAKLNKVLESKPFGYDEERYRFKISRSNDKTFGRYYDVFRSGQNFVQNDLFTNQLTDKNQALMQDLYLQLVNESDDPKQHKLIEEYTDYRSFMSYDIVITNKRGEESYFSKINKEKSGGETQTPFYVIIAASFDQIIHGGYGQRSTGCIVMLDEAFNNMDESHIDSMMKYFLQLDIQPIIAVPTQRAKTIMPYVDTTIGLVKLQDRVYPRIFTKANNEVRNGNPE